MEKIIFIITILLLMNVSLYAQFDIPDEKMLFNIDQELSNQLDNAGQHFVDEGYLSGGVSMIAYKGNIIYQKAFGMQSIEENQPMQMNSLFRIASMTKPLTTLAVLLLADEGKLKLDDNAGSYLPQISLIKVLEADGSLKDPAREVTIRNLLMHTSGIRNRGNDWFKNNGVDFSKATTLEEYVNLVLKAPLMFDPGEGFNYGMNNDICARIVEVVTNQDYADFLKERILKPLEMKNTYYIVPDKDIERMCSLYSFKDGELKLAEGKEAVQSEFPMGNGQLVSTAGDYMNFLNMLSAGGVYKGNRLLKEETLKMMAEDKLPQDIPVQVGNIVFPNTGFGLSVAISRNNSDIWKPLEIKFENLFQHLPKGSYIWPGIANTYFWVDPVNEIYGVVFTQSANPGMFGNFQEFTQTFYSKFLD